MSHRAAFHHINSSPLPHGKAKRTSSISSSPSTSSSSTLQDATPSDATCYELPEEEVDRISELERDRKPRKQVAFSAVSLEIGPIKGYRPDSAQLRHTDTSVFHSPPPPRLTDATIKSSKLAARHLAVALDRGVAQHAPKILKEKNQDDGISSQVKRTVLKTIPMDAKQPQHVRFSPTTITVPLPVLSRNSPPTDHATPKVLPRPTTEIVFCSDVPPDPSACADINDILRTVLNIPGFDFASYAQDRTYVARRMYLASAASSAPSRPDASPASLLTVDSQTECAMFLEKSLSAVFTPSRLRRLCPQPFVDSDLFVVRCGPDQTSGNSMFAMKDISTHQLILSERPLAIFPFVVALDGPQKGAYFEAFQCLSSELRNAVSQLDGGAFSSMSGQESGGDDRDRYDFQDIFVRNSLQIDLPVPTNCQPHPELSAHRGLFLQATRIKHSCRPNAVWSWDLQSFSILIRAVRPIAVDEEITVAFVSPEQPYEARKNALWLSKGQQCVCASCGGGKGGLEEGVNETSNSKTIQEGDSAREYLVQFRNLPLGSLSLSGCDNHSNDQRLCLDCPIHDSIISFEQWFKDKSVPEDLLVTAHKEALHIIQSEGLHILDTQQHKARPTCKFDSSLSDSSDLLCAVSSPLSPSSLKKASSQVFPCEQRDLGYHIDALVLCYSALGDTANFLKCLTKAIKDRDERGAWMLESKLRLRRAVVTTPSEKDEIRKRERAERNVLAFRMRLAFSKWAANPATFPLWARRKGGVFAAVSPPMATGTDVFELCDSLEEYALGCIVVEASHA